MKKAEDNRETKDISVDELISRLMKESSSTLSHISALRRYFDPSCKKPGQQETKQKQ